MSELQRSRLLTAAVGAVAEHGYSDASVSRITARAHVSRRTFYELFENREECLVAVLDHAAELIATEAAVAGIAELSWRERVRTGLWIVLSVLEREPVLAQVCIVHSARGGSLVLERRAELLGQLAAVVDAGRFENVRGCECTPLTAEGLVGAALTIVHGRLWREDAEPLTGLFEELLGMIMLPYIGVAAVRREQTRPTPAPLGALPHEESQAVAEDPLRDLPMRLTYRTARVLESVADDPGASNRQVGERSGIGDQGQVSKLLGRLKGLGLLSNGGGGHLRGEPNAWVLTLKGEQVARSIRAYAPNTNNRRTP